MNSTDLLNQLEKATTIKDIAKVIYKDWSKVNYAAKPYLDAMLELEKSEDYYGADSAKSVVSYFLGNATSYKGDVARESKKKLRQLIK